MSNHLGEFVNARRLELDLSRSETVRKLGYTNLNRGCRRLCDVEGGLWINEDFLMRLTTLLGIEPRVIQELIDRDRQEYVAEWEKWADEPVPISVVMRAIPGFMVGVTVPADVKTPDETIAFAQGLAARLGKKVFVVLSRRETVGINEQGEITGRFKATPEHDPAPSMHLGNKKFLFHFGSIGEIEPYKQQEKPGE
jgi:hypothetical protein